LTSITALDCSSGYNIKMLSMCKSIRILLLQRSKLGQLGTLWIPQRARRC
jgi:hypothetical protein